MSALGQVIHDELSSHARMAAPQAFHASCTCGWSGPAVYFVRHQAEAVAGVVAGWVRDTVLTEVKTEPPAEPKDCPHADPMRYCDGCVVTPCPIGLGR